MGSGSLAPSACTQARSDGPSRKPAKAEAMPTGARGAARADVEGCSRFISLDEATDVDATVGTRPAILLP